MPENEWHEIRLHYLITLSVIIVAIVYKSSWGSLLWIPVWSEKNELLFEDESTLAEGFFADVDIPKRFFKAEIRSRRCATSVLALNLGLFVGDALENDDVLCMI